MEWHYSINGNQAGPVSAEEFQNLVASGVIQPSTLVWREGMSDWLPYASVMGGAPTSGMAPTYAAPYAQRGYDDFEYAGFWIRFGGLLLDGIFLGIVQIAIRTIFIQSGMVPTFGEPTQPDHALGEMILSLINLAIGVIYATYFLGSKFQATPGMMICRIRIIVDDGTDCSYLRAFGRYFAAFLSAIILFIGYLMCAWDSEKRTLHDMICSTRVIRK